MNITLAGGGTGGHVFPAIAIAQEFQRRDEGHALQFIGSVRGLEAQVLPRAGYQLATVDVQGFAGKGMVKKIQSLITVVPAVLHARSLLRAFGSDIVIGVGGYVSFPAALAGRLLGLPVVVHEQNSVPGLCNRMLGFFARRIFVTYAESLRFFPARKTVHSGLPLRTLPDSFSESLRDSAVRTVCVLGGSQGAGEINDAVIEALPLLVGSSMAIRFIHQTGAQDAGRVEAAYRQSGCHAVVAGFFDDMLERLAAADIVIARAGAGTLAELAACGRASILIPYRYAAGDHQRKNALAFVRSGAALLLESHELSGSALAHMVLDLLGNPGRLRDLERQARLLARPRAAQIIVDECCRLVTA
jgi:UDP-N-acetylglucosamine--N-acetylmuramyl-(pentapeptide) pyrophosphoryl-undecaprenol N-acetylglucosamine transferase